MKNNKQKFHETKVCRAEEWQNQSTNNGLFVVYIQASQSAISEVYLSMGKTRFNL